MFQKKKLRERKQNRFNLQTIFNNLGYTLDTEENVQQCKSCKEELEGIYDHIVESIRVGSNCVWYKDGEKSNCFLNLEKKLRSSKPQWQTYISRERNSES